MGYKKVFTFKAGVPGWVAAGFELDTSLAIPACKVPSVNSVQLKTMQQQVLVLDIRNQLEVMTMGRFSNALHIPFEDLEMRSKEIPRDTAIVVVDYSGVEFNCAGGYLKEMGVQDVRGLQGGVKDWIKQGYDLEK
jgi:rhodanese-related sulfurtransferase